MADPLLFHLTVLAVRFSNGATDAKKDMDMEMLRKHQIEPEVLEEAVARIMATRESNTYPAFAVTLKACQAVRAERSRSHDDEKVYTLAEARELAERRLRLINKTPNLIRQIPITDANIDLHVAQMRREGWSIEGGEGSA